MAKVVTAFIKKTETGRRLAISDIHGCSRTFKKLLKKVELTKNDQLFLLGDLINKGPNSHEVLDKVLKLKEKGYTVFVIRGNHEQLVIQSKRKSIAQRKRTLISLNSMNLLNGKHLNEDYLNLLTSSFHYLELDHFFLVHAGFNYTKNTFSNKKDMLFTRDFIYNKQLFAGKQIIVGHTPKNIRSIKKSVKNEDDIICIDNGCTNTNDKDQGNLICLNLDTFTLHSQKFIEK